MTRHSCSTLWSVGFLALLVGLLACAAPSWGQTPTECGGYLIGYFNGVRTRLFDAVDSAKRVGHLIGTTFTQCGEHQCAKEYVRHLLFYNPTDGFMEDLAETFAQRVGDTIGNRYEYLWESHYGASDLFWDVLSVDVPILGTLWDVLANAQADTAAAFWGDLLSNLPTEATYEEHRKILDAEAKVGRKMLLVAHSQGNLFVNQAYDHIAPKVGEDSVKVLHIAPATRTRRGDYVLSDWDLVIGGLRRFTGRETATPNTKMRFWHKEPLGHGLLEVYLSLHLPARDKIKDLMEQAFNSLMTPADFPPPPTDLELIQTQDSGTLFWTPPQYEMEPLACDIPAYLVYRDDQPEPRIVEDGMTYYFDSHIPEAPPACYQVTSMLHNGEESVLSEQVCYTPFSLQISEIRCSQLITRTDHEYTIRFHEFDVTGTATGRIGAILLPVSYNAYDDFNKEGRGQRLTCPSWQRTVKVGPFIGENEDDSAIGYPRTVRYCKRGADDPPTTEFEWRDDTNRAARLTVTIELHSEDIVRLNPRSPKLNWMTDAKLQAFLAIQTGESAECIPSFVFNLPQ